MQGWHWLPWHGFYGAVKEPNKSTAQSQTQTQAHATPKTAAPMVKPQVSASFATASTVAVQHDATTLLSQIATAALPAITPEEILTPTLPEDPAICQRRAKSIVRAKRPAKEKL